MIGINTLIIRISILGSAPAKGIGFANTSNLVGIIAEQVIQEYFSRPHLGINIQPTSPNFGQAYDFPIKWGAYLTGVELINLAGRSNLQPGDIITKIGDIALDEEHTFVNEMFAFQPGEPLAIEILRGDSAIRIQVTFGETMSD